MTNIINYGISETLKGLFAQLKETPGQNGLKYHRKDVDKLAQDIVCRNYGSGCYELSFLCWAVVNHPQYLVSPLLNFFWLEENLSPAAFRQAFSDDIATQAGLISMTSECLQLNLKQQSDATTFAISPTRVSKLAVLLEFIVSINPTLITKMESQLLNANATNIKGLASDLQKVIYAYLKEHIPEASTQERFRAISDWLQLHNINADNLTDQHVLDFWLNPPAKPSYIKYATALDDLLDAVTAIQVVDDTYNAEYALSLGDNLEQGEVSTDWVQNTLFEQTQNSTDCAWLCHSPKFLTLAQYQPIQPLLNHGQLAHQLPLSFLRLAIFGSWQSVLVQAKRKSANVVADKLQHPPKRDFQDYLTELAQSSLQCKQVQKAIGHILYSLQSPVFVGVLLKFLPSTLQVALKAQMQAQLDSGLVSQDTLQLSMFLNIQQWLTQQPEAQALLSEAEKSFKNNNKDGFKHLPNAEDLDRYQDGNDALQHCLHTIKQYEQALKKLVKNASIAEIYRSDLCIFKGRFEQIYGVTHG